MAKAIHLCDNEIGPLLSAIPSPPASLNCVGDTGLVKVKGIAIVGTRNPSEKELDLAFDLAEAAARTGLSVISGLALGIDSAAHRGALAAGGKTVAFLGCGLRQISPASNRPLAKEIYESGGLIASEVQLDQETRPQHLVARNRLISGLALATIVISSGVDGGTMHTVRFAYLQGKPLYCPSGIGSAGVKMLLEQPASEAAQESKALRPLTKLELGEAPLARAFISDRTGIATLLESLISRQ